MAAAAYVPADSSITLSALAYLHSGEGEMLRAEVATMLAEQGAATVAGIAGLRKKYAAEIVHAALTLGQLQKKARAKFPELAYTWCVPEALEQATDARVAAHKAGRFAAAGAERILDLCAGIGGDSMGLARVAPVTSVDLSAVRGRCLEYNLAQLGLSCEVRVEDVRQAMSRAGQGVFFHIDPARRVEGKRSAAYGDLIPGPEVLTEVMARFEGGAIKLSSAVEFESLPAGHLEIVGRNRSVVQAVLWTGRLAESFAVGTRTASVVYDDGSVFSYTAPPESPALADAVGSYLFEADPALTRAGLAGVLGRELGLRALTVDGGYLTGSQILTHAGMVGFRVLLTVPYSQERVTAALSHLPAGEAGSVEVKTRGGIAGVDTDKLQLIWSAATTSRRTVLVYRRGGETVATIAERVSMGG